jgi:protoheme IX farnesyltransferase
MPHSDPNIASSDRARAVAASAPAADRRVTDVLKDYWELTKPEISFLVVVSALAGYLLGAPAGIDGWTLLITLVGVGLCAGGVGMLNHLIEHRIDAQMKRTMRRPLPAGRVSSTTVRTVGTGMVCAGVGLLCPLVNPLTAILAALTAILYLYVYTPLKQTTKWNTLIGTVPGALPALGGYTAATGDVGAAGWAIFAILACWQMPHFLSLAWMYRKDYARGGYAMLPVVEPEGDSTAYQTILFTALLLVVSLLPAWMGPMGWLYAAGALPLGLWFLWTAVAFHLERTGQQARRVLKASIIYIPVLVLLIVADWLVL